MINACIFMQFLYVRTERMDKNVWSIIIWYLTWHVRCATHYYLYSNLVETEVNDGNDDDNNDNNTDLSENCAQKPK